VRRTGGLHEHLSNGGDVDQEVSDLHAWRSILDEHA
jgi:hypothetical protein